MSHPLFIFTIYDKKSESHQTPFGAPSRAAAVRMFKDEVNASSSQSMVARHAEDFDLIHLVTVDVSTGALIDSPNLIVVSGLSVREAPASAGQAA